MPKSPASSKSKSLSEPRQDESGLLHVHPPKQRLSDLTVAESLQEWETMGVGLEYRRGEELSHRELAKDDNRRAKATAERNAIAKLRGQVIRKRLKVREKRVELRREQAAASQLDANYTTILSAFMVQGASTDPTSLYAAFEKCRKARDTVGPIEEDYNQLEDTLIELEDTLDERENKFYRDYPAISVASNSPISVASSPYVPTTASGSLVEGDEPSQDKEYLVKLGEANIMKERLDDLLFERAQYEEESRIRSPYGIPLEASSEMFLRNFDEIYRKSLEDLQAVEDQVRELKRTSSTGLQVTSQPPSGNETLQSLEEPVPSANESHRRLSELFPNSRPEFLGEFANTRDRINGWLLHILQHSPLDADLHRAMLGNYAVDDNKWAEMLLRTWQLDDAAKGGPLTMDHSVSSGLSSYLSSIRTSRTSPSRSAVNIDSNFIATSSNSRTSIPALPSTAAYLKPVEDWVDFHNTDALRVYLSKHPRLRTRERRPNRAHLDAGHWPMAPRSGHSSLPSSFDPKTSKSYSL